MAVWQEQLRRDQKQSLLARRVERIQAVEAPIEGTALTLERLQQLRQHQQQPEVRIGRLTDQKCIE